MKPKKSLGQNFLNDDRILNDIIKSGNITNNGAIKKKNTLPHITKYK